MERKKNNVIKNEKFERPKMKQTKLKTSRRKGIWGKECWVGIKEMKMKGVSVSLQQHMPYFRKRMVWEILHRKLL